MKTRFKPVRLSLADIIGKEAADCISIAAARLTGAKEAPLRGLGRARLEFFPEKLSRALTSFLPQTGTVMTRPLRVTPSGASTRGFNDATSLARSPLGGLGYYRAGEDGRLYFAAKSEHYHTPLGHRFPGYQLVDIAKLLGVCNATHNNTRGVITRTLELELVRCANGLERGDAAGLAKVLGSSKPTVLNRVLNLETGSLAAEAAFKMMLARFHLVQDGAPPPPLKGFTPVFVVIGDDQGGVSANYHGTTILTQVMRGMWPGFRQILEGSGALKIVPVRPNDAAGLERVFRTYTRGRYRIAGFLHEIVLMNYGAVLLSTPFLRRAHALCRRHDVPVLVDEIQSGAWSPQMFMYREYGLTPSFVALGKGFPGGEYPASRILFSSAYDVLPQFGALVTNGQEELSSLSYLITMRWIEANADVMRATGEHYEAGVRKLAARFSRVVSKAEGCRHMSSLFFHEMEHAKAFVKALSDGGIDVSVQTYKTASMPSVLTKLPLIAGYEAVDMVLGRMRDALRDLAARD